MLKKKLKKIVKACHESEDPALLTFAAYADHLRSYLSNDKAEDAALRAYGDALAQVDLSGVVKAQEALVASRNAVDANHAVEAPKDGCPIDKKRKKAKKDKSTAK